MSQITVKSTSSIPMRWLLREKTFVIESEMSLDECVAHMRRWRTPYNSWGIRQFEVIVDQISSNTRYFKILKTNYHERWGARELTAGVKAVGLITIDDSSGKAHIHGSIKLGVLIVLLGIYVSVGFIIFGVVEKLYIGIPIGIIFAFIWSYSASVEYQRLHTKLAELGTIRTE